MVDNERLSINKSVIAMSNLSFDHPLSNFELFELQNLLISGIPLSQIYFKEDVDIDTIEKVKLLLEGLPNVNDEAIEKYIMKNVSDVEKEKMLSMNFCNIDTWYISYTKESNRYSVTQISKYRKIEEWFNEILYEANSRGLSQLDKICFLYDKVKMLEFDTNTKYDRIPEIISDNRSTLYGYNLIFNELLSKIGIDSFIGKIENKDEINYVTLANVDDDYYKVEGMYFFDPSMDTIDKDQYKNNLARKMNYNFFGINVEKLKKMYPKKNMQFFLRLLASDDSFEFNHLINLKGNKDSEELKTIENAFNTSLKEIFSKISSSVELHRDTFINIITKGIESYPDDVVDKKLLSKVISNNYNVRNEELFTNISVNKKHKVDI